MSKEEEWKHAMMEMHEWLRHKIKYSDEVVSGEMSMDKFDTFEECKAKLYEIRRDNNLQFDGPIYFDKPKQR